MPNNFLMFVLSGKEVSVKKVQKCSISPPGRTRKYLLLVVGFDATTFVFCFFA